MSAIAREKTSEMSRLGAEKCLHFRNSGSLFQSFLHVFRLGGLALVRIRGVSVIARCPRKARVDCICTGNSGESAKENVKC